MMENDRGKAQHRGGTFMMTYGRREGGDVVSIADVERGNACGCFCLSCGAPLVAKKGEINAHHFAHGDTECQSGFAVYARHLAIALLRADMRMCVPEPQTDVKLVLATDGALTSIGATENRGLHPAKPANQTVVHDGLAHPVPVDVPCDLVVSVKGHPLGIVLNMGTERGRAALIRAAKKNDLTVMEIDLSEFAGTNGSEIDDIRRFILFLAPRRFLFSRKEAMARASAERDAEIAIRNIVVQATSPAPLLESKIIRSERRVGDMLDAIGMEVFGDVSLDASASLATDAAWMNAFSCSPDVWQMLVLSAFRSRWLQRGSPMSAGSLLFTLRRNPLRPMWRGIFRTNCDLMDQASINMCVLWHAAGEAYIRKVLDVNYKSPVRIIDEYLTAIIGETIGDMTIHAAGTGREGQNLYTIQMW